MALTDLKYKWWSYPMKPVLMPIDGIHDLNLSKYTMEKKFDGWRVIVIQDKRTEVWNRHKKKINISEELQEELSTLKLPRGSVLDGEIWNPLKRGGWTNIELWDVIRNGTKNLSNDSIEVRRENLLELVNETERIRVVESMEPCIQKIREIEKEAKENRKINKSRSGFIHGIVLKAKKSKRYDSANRSQENGNWLKVVFDGMKGYEPKI